MQCPNCGAPAMGERFCQRCGAARPTPSAQAPVLGKLGIPWHSAQAPVGAQQAPSSAPELHGKKPGTLGELFAQKRQPLPREASAPQRARRWTNRLGNVARVTGHPRQEKSPAPLRLRPGPNAMSGSQVAPSDIVTTDAAPLSASHAGRMPVMPNAPNPSEPPAQQPPIEVEIFSDGYIDSGKGWRYAPLPSSTLPTLPDITASSSPAGLSAPSPLPSRPAAPTVGPTTPWRRPPMGPLEANGAKMENAQLPIAQRLSQSVEQQIRSRVPVSPGGMGRTAVNVLLVALVLLILAVPITIGLQRISHTSAISQPQHTPPAQTLTPTPTLAPGFAGYETNLFSIAYPTGWVATLSSQPSANRATLTGTRFANTQYSEEDIYTTTAIPLDELEQFASGVVQAITGSEVAQPLVADQARSYDGAQWVESDYTFTQVRGSAETRMQMRVLACDQGATTYLIVASAPQSVFTRVNTSAFEPMLRSFRFQ